MSRTRLIKPAFFKHYDLYLAERESGLPLRVAFAGLWTVTDKEGRFRWKADIKPDILPYDECDVINVLETLERHGFVQRYVVDGKSYGLIPSFGDHQTFHKTERKSELPPPPSHGGPTVIEREPTVTPMAVTGTVAVAGTVASTGADAVTQLLADFDFGPFAPAIEGICRSARHPASVIATLRMHIAGEMQHEKGTPLEVGLAAQQFLADGNEFNAMHFAGFIRKAKRSGERTENRKRNDAEQRRIESEQEKERRDKAEAQRVDDELRAFEREYPERFAALRQQAERLVKGTVSGMFRSEAIRSNLISLVRQGAETAA